MACACQGFGRGAAILLSAAFLSGVAGCGSTAGDLSGPARFGQVPPESVAVEEIRALAKVSPGQVVGVEGRVVQQCPSAGCWFRVQDGTGVVLVDLNPLGARLKSQRVGEAVRVVGRVERVQGQLRLAAQFVEFREGDGTGQTEAADNGERAR